MAGTESSFRATREERGLPEKVFSDPGNRRARRILTSFAVLALLILGWLIVFSVALVSGQQSASTLPEKLMGLKRPLLELDKLVAPRALLGPTFSADHEEVHSHSSVADCTAGEGNLSTRKLRVYAVIPSELPFAESSLEQGCGAIDVLMPNWFELELIGTELRVRGAEEDTQEPVRRYASRDEGATEIIPIVRLGKFSSMLIETASGRNQMLRALNGIASKLAKDPLIKGLCVQGGGLETAVYGDVARLMEPFADQLSGLDLVSCAAFSAHAPPTNVQVLDGLADLIMVQTFQSPWVGSAPSPVSSTPLFEKRTELAQKLVSKSTLVLAVATQSVAWISGRPTPETVPYAELMRRLARETDSPRYERTVGSSHVAFVGENGRHHQVWMSDAASMINHLSSLKQAGLTNVGIWSLGYEDPGIWPVIRSHRRGAQIDADELQSVIVNGFVSYTGQGPFVSPLALPIPGARELEIDPGTGKVLTQSYLTLPQPSAVHLYGRVEPGKVVLTFDDGPVPEFTIDILDILEETGVPGSFFVLGRNALRFPELVKRILADGHELGSHTYWHSDMSEVSATRARMEINSVQNLITAITGRQTLLYREPYMRSGGPITSRKVASLLPVENAGYFIAGMDVVPRDWLDRSAEALAEDIIRQIEERGGGVVLLHDGGGDQTATVKALPIVIRELRERGYEFASLADQLGVLPADFHPKADAYTTAFQKVSFLLVGRSWSFLQMAFWTVLAIGSARALIMLWLACRRRKHWVKYGEGYLSAAVVIPAYNEEAVIERCIDHVLQSDYPHMRIIVVDDGSKDQTYQLACRYENNGNVKVISQPNGGKASALNRALDETESEVLICIDADSQIHRKAVSHMMAHFNDPKIGAVAGRVVVGNRRNLLTRLQALEYITGQSIERRAKETMNAIPVVPGAIGAWRTDAVLEAGIFSSETSTEDADMTMAVIRSDYRVIYDERAVATTEAPASISGLLQQRLRWNLGMMQAGWKHVGAYGERRALGLFSLTDLAVFGYLMPLLAPLADFFLILLLAGAIGDLTGSGPASFDVPYHLLLAYLLLPSFDILTAIVAFKLDPKEDRRLLFLLPVQRLLYRPFLYISVYRSIWRALSGTLARWGSISRIGYRFDHERVA